MIRFSYMYSKTTSKTDNIQYTSNIHICNIKLYKTVLKKHMRRLVKNCVCITRWRHRTFARC